MRRLSTVVAMVTGMAALAVGVAPAAQAETGPETSSFVVALG